MKFVFPSALLRPEHAAILALACSAFLFAQARAEDPASLLAKYDFEDTPAWIPNWGGGLGSTYKPATGWKTPFVVSLDEDNPHSGAKSLRFELNDTSEKEKIVHSPSISVEPSDAERVVRVRLFARASGFGDKGVGIRILERDANGASIRLLGTEKTLIPIPDSDEWIELEGGGTLHSRTASISFMLVAYQAEAPATVWIDDVSVELEPNAAP